jgi:hypothetical protein
VEVVELSIAAERCGEDKALEANVKADYSRACMTKQGNEVLERVDVIKLELIGSSSFQTVECSHKTMKTNRSAVSRAIPR